MENIIVDHKFRELLLPTVLIAMTLNITAIVDSMFVSTYIGANGQAALQILEPLILFVTVFEWLFGLGGQILSLNKKAEFDTEGSNLYFTTSIVVTVIITVLLGIICLIVPDTIAMILHSPNNVTPYVKDYGVFLFISFPIVTTLAVLTQFVRVDGHPNLASALIIIANIINISLDFVFLDVLQIGIAGASLATLIGYIVGMICALKYFRDPKRTFKFIHPKIPIKKWIKSTIEICKIGIPGASMGIFDLIYVEIMNIILIATVGNIGLNAFNICVNALLIISILTVGISETLSSIVPVYYSQNDYFNLNHLIRRSIIFTMICSIVFIIFLWILPNGFLMFFNLHDHASVLEITNAVQIYSLAFIPIVFSTILIFYYEAIERTTASTLLSFISTFLGPLVMTIVLYPIMGIKGIWLSFAAGIVLSLIAVAIYVKIIEMREKEYKGLFFIKKYLIPKTRNYSLKNPNDNTKTEIFNHLKSLNASENDCKTITKLIDEIFKFNNEDILIEFLIIDYEDKITINLKDEGKHNIEKSISEELSKNENMKFTEVLGFNNAEYTINKN